MKSKKSIQVIAVYAIMILMLIFGNIAVPGFISTNNIAVILREMSFLGICAIGQTLAILTGGIDLSLSNTLLLCNIMSAFIVSGSDKNVPAALLVCLLVSTAIGLVNFAGVYLLHIPAMIMTLASGSAVYGIAYIYCDGAPKGKSSPFTSALVNSRFLGTINWTTVIWLILSVVIIIVLKYSVFGRSVYAIGVNPVTASYSGISVPKTLAVIYILSSVLAGFTGFLFLGYTGTAYLSTGATYNMDSIASVVIGGTSIAGGSGGYLGTIAGVGIMTILTSLLTAMAVPQAGKDIIQGTLIIVLLVTVYGRKKKE
ncbi:MAG: ABC transporter permease [Firmicutes bacterium]|nr:ABC transporter permease [Bacillota bacterium]